MKEYVLDVSKWRCGGFFSLLRSVNALGVGATQLRNTLGEMCCLGQFAQQVIGDDSKLTGESHPEDLAKKLNSRYDPNFVNSDMANTKLTFDLMSINDEGGTSIAQKVELMRRVMLKSGLQLKVINGEQYGVTE